MKYIKKPIPVDISEPWHRPGDHPNVKDSEEAQWMRSNTTWYTITPFEREDAFCNHCLRPVHEHGWIGTLEGGHIVCPGDRIVTGVRGEQYPIKPDIFLETYEPAPKTLHELVEDLERKASERENSEPIKNIDLK